MNIIAFAGRKQSGKTSCSQYIANIWRTGMLGNVRVYNFADPLKKDICMNILGLSHEQCYGTDLQKNELVNCYWQNKQLTAREVMQFVGTDIFRTMQNNVWADATIKRILSEKPDMGLIADCRFPNEVESIKNAGGIVIKLTRNPFNSEHASETALDPENYDSTNFDLIVNNHLMSIDEQNSFIHNFLVNKGILQ